MANKPIHKTIVKEIIQEPEPVKMVVIPKIRLKAEKGYHNGCIVGGVGMNWKAEEERDVTWAQYEQLMNDDVNAFARVK